MLCYIYNYTFIILLLCSNVSSSVRQESRGLVLVKTLTLLVIATYSDSMFPSVCVEAVEKLGDD